MTFREFLNSLGPKNRALPIATLRAAYERIHGTPGPPATRPGLQRPEPAPGLSTEAPPPAPGAATPGAAADSSPAAAPPSPALPVNPLLEEQLVGIDTEIANLPGLYNPQRRVLATETAAELAEAGYFNDVQAQGSTPDADGNISFKLVTGRDGRLYRQAFRQVNANHASTGTLGSSFSRNDRKDTRRVLNTQRERAQRGFGQQQDSLTQAQAASLRGLQSSRGGARADIAQWQAAQTAVPAPPQAPTTPEQGGAQPGGNQDLPRQIFYASDNGLQNKLDNRFGAGTYEVRRRGPNAPTNQRFIAVRR